MGVEVGWDGGSEATHVENGARYWTGTSHFHRMSDPDVPTPPANLPDREGLPAISPDHMEMELGGVMDEVVPGRGYDMPPMVGIGGSAGSIEALIEFFGGMPVDTGMVFVVILHLSREHESTLAEVLGRATRMPVVQARDRQPVEANHVYVIPPGKLLSTVDGHLKLTPMEHTLGRRVVVDLFFRTLADTHGPNATAIVLSGADGDGALGIKRIKERGGLTIAQDPEEAVHGSMPLSAIATRMVDWVLRVGEMPGRLVEYVQSAGRLKLPPEEGPQPAEAPRTAAETAETALREVLTFLRARTGRDFSYYKRATILRRLARRMQVNSVVDVPEYLGFLRTHPGEAGALLQDLLISVTNFFRDREAFDALEGRMPEIFEGKRMGDAVRVWTVACATGEEAYSVAMLLCEYAEKLESPPSIQVFATDLDEEVIAAAREGIYPLTIAADVSEERLRRFFIKEHRGYRVRRELREMVLFALHDVLKDSPFSRVDLLTCRNLLIYLTREAQQRAFEIFHFALRGEGRLFLGTSESMDDGSALFSVLDKVHRIFARRAVARVPLPLPVGASALRRALEARGTSGTGPVVHGAAFAQTSQSAAVRAAELGGEHRVSWEELHFRLIERFAPPSLIVDQDYNIVHVSENAGRYLRFAGGAPSVNLMKVVNPMLRVELRAALFRAAQSSAPVEVFRVPVEVEGEREAVDIRVSPAQEIAPDYLLVVFTVREKQGAGEPQQSMEAEPAVRNLEREIEQVKSRLRDTVEQYEASTEELKASNEELQAMNEELRSATEELETSREELQSINEELTTVNQELKSSVEELAHSNSDLHNLMAATAIGTIFMDRQLRIARYTPPAVALFNLIPGDVGRPIADLKHRLEYPGLTEDVEEVLRTLIPIEREVHDADGRWFIARLLPYRTTQDVIAGAVLTFVDITARKVSEAALEQSREELWDALQDTERARADAETAGCAKDHFLAVLSHELRTPLTPVVMAVQMLAQRHDLPADVPSALKMIERNIRIEAHLIDDLLDVTRISQGKLAIARAEVDLHEAIRTALEISMPDIDAKSQQLSVALDATEYRLSGDERRLQQVVWNVLKNASKFSPAGGSIQLRTRNEGVSIVVEITDSGVGMEGDVVEKIFNPFEQADATVAREFGGLGLGLAISKATVEAHGGKLAARSLGRGKGATFTATLPLDTGNGAGEA